MKVDRIIHDKRGYNYKNNNKQKYFPGSEGSFLANEMRQQVLEEAKYGCAMCGKTKNIRVHHIDGNDRHNEKNNLFVVCESHHRLIHARIKQGLHTPVRIVTVGTTVSSSSAHFLNNYPNDCKYIHGHQFKIEAVLKGLVVEPGFVVDFKELKKILMQFDHRCINYFIGFNPTMENLSRYFVAEILKEFFNVKYVKVRVWESEVSFVEAEFDREWEDKN